MKSSLEDTPAILKTTQRLIDKYYGIWEPRPADGAQTPSRAQSPAAPDDLPPPFMPPDDLPPFLPDEQTPFLPFSDPTPVSPREQQNFLIHAQSAETLGGSKREGSGGFQLRNKGGMGISASQSQRSTGPVSPSSGAPRKSPFAARSTPNLGTRRNVVSPRETHNVESGGDWFETIPKENEHGDQTADLSTNESITFDPMEGSTTPPTPHTPKGGKPLPKPPMQKNHARENSRDEGGLQSSGSQRSAPGWMNKRKTEDSS